MIIGLMQKIKPTGQCAGFGVADFEEFYMKRDIPFFLVLTLLLTAAALMFCLWVLPGGQDDSVQMENIPRGEEETNPILTGWQDLDGKRVYLMDNGVVANGWVIIDGRRHYFGEDGAPCTGWTELDGSKHYLDEDGIPLTGWQTLDTGRYYLDEDGIPLTGWQTLDTGRYYLDETGAMVTGWLEQEDGRCYLGEDGVLVSGWVELDGSRYCLDENGVPLTGWQETENGRYFLDDSGVMVTGWLEWEGSTYYLKEDGAAAVGKLVIDGETFYFSSKGVNILLVNRWNTVTSDYVPEGLVTAQCGVQMQEEAAAALDAMVEACKEAGYAPKVRTAYRDYTWQQALLNNKIAEGYSYNQAIQIVAIPGTSEHQTGLAVDISDSSYTKLNASQGDTAIQKWLHEHCWEYGFIVRYPDGTTSMTGIICESWHYRYMGVELAKEITELGVCLEEYLDTLTADGTTCGDPASLTAG